MVVPEYERALVALMTGIDPVEVDWRLQAGRGMSLYDLFASAWIEEQGGLHRLRLTASRRGVSKVAHPVGRLYLKARR